MNVSRKWEKEIPQKTDLAGVLRIRLSSISLLSFPENWKKVTSGLTPIRKGR